MMSERPDLTHLEIRQALLDNVDVLPSLSGKLVTGGRLNAEKAITAVPEPDRAIQLVAGCLVLAVLGRGRAARF
jgi:hypothetical protein